MGEAKRGRQGAISLSWDGKNHSTEASSRRIRIKRSGKRKLATKNDLFSRDYIIAQIFYLSSSKFTNFAKTFCGMIWCCCAACIVTDFWGGSA